MLFADPTSTAISSVETEPVPTGGVRRLVAALVTGWRRQRALIEWNRDLPRPPGCRHVPDRVWQRRSALLSLRATGDPR